MPTKEKTYNLVIFKPEVIKQAENVLVSTLAEKDRKITTQIFRIQLSATELWEHDTEEEFFADYRRGFEHAYFYKSFSYSKKVEFHIVGKNTQVSISLPHRADIEKVFNFLESSVEKCRLPKQPHKESKVKTDWVSETIEKVEGYYPLVGRKLKLALNKIESEEAEEWQSAAMLIRDAWIELTQHLCLVNQIDTSDIEPDAVVDRLKKLKINKTDEKLFDLARASFNLYSKHHDRSIDNHTAMACVISTIVSMLTVIREAI